MKPEWKKFVEEQKPADKPVVRPDKRFIELPGGVLKRRSATLGGPDEEHTQIMGKGINTGKEKKILGRPERKSSGLHRADLTPSGKGPTIRGRLGPRYDKEAKAYRRLRAKEEIEGERFTDPEALPDNLQMEGLIEEHADREQ